jgi:hypothetical protein
VSDAAIYASCELALALVELLKFILLPKVFTICRSFKHYFIEATVKRAATSHETKSKQEQGSKSENEQDKAAGVETEELKE